jgi:hypothetical protein
MLTVLLHKYLLIPYDSFSQMSTIYLTSIKIRAVPRIRVAFEAQILVLREI